MTGKNSAPPTSLPTFSDRSSLIQGGNGSHGSHRRLPTPVRSGARRIRNPSEPKPHFSVTDAMFIPAATLQADMMMPTQKSHSPQGKTSAVRQTSSIPATVSIKMRIRSFWIKMPFHFPATKPPTRTASQQGFHSVTCFR